METTLTCRQMFDFVADYLDGELAPPVRTDFEAHLHICPECMDYLASYRETLRFARDTRDEVDAEIPDALVRAILLSQRASAER